MIPPQQNWSASNLYHDDDRGVEHAPRASYTTTTALYHGCAVKLHHYLSRHLQSADDADDLLYDVFVVAFEHDFKLARMSEGEQRAWLWTVARNKMVDYHRRRQQRHFVTLDHIMEMEGDDGTPEQTFLQREEQERLQVCLSSLSALQQEVVQLRFIGGLRCAEIAAVLNKREGAVRTMLSRALDALRKIYTQ
jgi:RNA polymerase sigma-70 factor, ECF subfamily